MSRTPLFDKKLKNFLEAGDFGRDVSEMEMGWCQKYKVPPLKQSPEETFRIIGVHWAAFSWWWNTDAITGKKLLTHIHPHTPFKVTADEEWYKQDFIDRGVEYDSSISFVDQMFELVKNVPYSAHKNSEKPINSIARISFGDENSYFVVASKTKRGAYLENVTDSEDVIEVIMSDNIFRSQNVCQSSRVSDSYWIRNSRDLMNCWFAFDARNCSNCFGVWNKRHQEYLWFNEQLTKEEWEKRFESVKTDSRLAMEEHETRFKEIMGSEAVWPSAYMTNCQNCTGDYLDNCVDCTYAWTCDGSKNESYAIWGQLGSEDNVLGVFPMSSRCYVSPVAIQCENVKFSAFLTRCQNMEYCIECFDCENCFGCTNLRHKKFCILNKQYEEDEYWRLIDEIKCKMLEDGTYGEYLPPKFGYIPASSSNASTFFTRFTEEENEKYGVREFDHSLDGAFGEWGDKKFKPMSEVPDSVLELDADEFSKVVFFDEAAQRPYTYSKHELAVLQKLKSPPSMNHFIDRVWYLWKELNMGEYVNGTCQSCSVSVEHAKNAHYPNRKIYCQECYYKYIETNG